MTTKTNRDPAAPTSSQTPWTELDDDGIAALFHAQSARIAVLEGALRELSLADAHHAQAAPAFRSTANERLATAWSRARSLLARLEAK